MKQYRTELKYAFIFFVMTLIWMCIERLAGLHSTYIGLHPYYTSLYAIPAILVYVFALREKKKTFYSGIITYRQSFLTGIIMTIIIAAISPISQYITSTYITPHFFENAINHAVSNNKMTLDEAVNYFNLQNYLKESFIGALFMGVITTAIVSIFIRKK